MIFHLFILKSIMVHNSFDWNFSEQKCLEIIHTTLIGILKKQSDQKLPLNELMTLFNTRTKHHKIHQRKKFNNFVKYIKMNYGSSKHFFDEFLIYGISEKNNQLSIHLLESELKYHDINMFHRITNENEWIIL